MLIANSWKEYEVLDCGDGAKLERWGTGLNSFILSRPDPQILWPKEKPELWSKADGVYTRSADGGGSWKFRKKMPDKWQINYGDLKFWVRPTDFKHMGLFPEQAANWDWMTSLIKKSGRKISVLNLFAYTGAATIAAASAGSPDASVGVHVTHVDSAKGMVEWASENAKLNGVEARWIVDDVLKFVEREKRRGNKYDAIIMDPPSYGRGTTGETWKIEKMLWPLVASCRDILSDQPLFFLINSYTTGLGRIVIENILDSAMGKFGGTKSSHEIALPISGSKKLLPAGISGQWQIS